MELRHLRYFRAVAEHRGFTEAARHLHVSQSGVSGQIRDLEREIGVTLLQRTSREVSLTPEGAVLLREARQILEQADRAIELTQRASRGQFGSLTIGLCGPATAPFLPKLIRAFRKRHPGVRLALKDIDPAHQPEALLARHIDIGFTRGVPVRFKSLLSAEVLFREPVVALLPRGHALADGPAIRLADLASERFVLYSRELTPELFDGVVARCRKARFSPDLAESPNLWQSVVTMVEAGEGVSLVPSSVRALGSSAVAFVPLAGSAFLLDVIMAWRGDEQDPLRAGFHSMVLDHLPEIHRVMGVDPL